MASDSFTPIEGRVLEVLSDGLSHPRQELLDCLQDDQAARTALQMHVSRIRKKLRPQGQDIVCEVKGYGIYYRHVRLLYSAADGRH
jgi:DNA-binding response OmpR family regulator